MNFSKQQISYILKTAYKNSRHAIVRDETVFIDDIVMTPKIGLERNVNLTFRGIPIDLTVDKENLERAYKILYRVYDKQKQRQDIRDFFQNLSDKLTCNYKLEHMSDKEIGAWFALDKINKHQNTAKIQRVDYMFKIRVGNVELSHVPEIEKNRIFMVVFGDNIIDISHRDNQYLYKRASDLFFNIYRKRIYPVLLRKQKEKENR